MENKHAVSDTGKLFEAGSQEEITSLKKSLAQDLEEYVDDLGKIEGSNPFTITPFDDKKEITYNEDEKFHVEFLQEMDTGKRVVRFSKSGYASEKLTVVTAQLQDMTKLRYMGFDIGSASQMHGFIKKMCMHKGIKPTSIGASTGFAKTKNNETVFFNGEYTADKNMPNDLTKCLNRLLEVRQFKQILVCSVIGMFASYLKIRVTPIINIWGTGLNSSFLKALILSPFDNSLDGYRDIFCKDSSASKLSTERDIIPVIVDLRTYGDRDYGYDQSGDGYYLNGHGQFHAPLFIISESPCFKDVHISIEIPKDISFERVYFDTFSVQAVDLLYTEIKRLQSILLKHQGLLSLYIGRKLCSSNTDSLYAKYFEEIMDERDFSFDEEKGGMTDALGLTIQDVLKTLFKFSKEDWILDWSGIIMETYSKAMQLYHRIEDFLEINEESIKESAKHYTDTDNGFRSEIKDKDYLYIQEGAFNRLFSDFATSKFFIFDYWENNKKFSAPKKGNIKTQPYLKRITVGSDETEIKQQRKWFYEFCLTDLQNEYPKGMKAASTIAIKAQELFALIHKRVTNNPETVSISPQEYSNKQLGFWVQWDDKKYLSISKGSFIDLCLSLSNSKSIANISDKIVKFWMEKFNKTEQDNFAVSVEVGDSKISAEFYEFCWTDMEAAYMVKHSPSNSEEDNAK